MLASTPTNDELRYFDEYCYKMYGKTFHLKEMAVDSNGYRIPVFDLNDPVVDVKFEKTPKFRLEPRWTKGYYNVEFTSIQQMIDLVNSLTIDKARALGFVDSPSIGDTYSEQCIKYKNCILEARMIGSNTIHIYKDEKFLCEINGWDGSPYGKVYFLPSFNAVVCMRNDAAYIDIYDMNTDRRLGYIDNGIYIYELK